MVKAPIGYDNRGRLKQEIRPGGSTAYKLTYEYDQGGNRTKKINASTGKEVRYIYDVADSSVSGTKNNRLLKSQEVLTAPPNTVFSTTWYAYNCAGNVSRVITNVAGTQAYTTTRLSYAGNERTVLFALQETWNWNGTSSPVINYAVQWLREFRYESGRARYLNRKVDPVTMTPIAAETTWTDYDGDEPYGDFAILLSGQTWFASNTRSYQPGVAAVDPWTNTGGANTKYYHSDHLGTTRTMSTTSGFSGGTRVFTAFGERTFGPTPPDRYGYVGAHGYQTHDDLPFQHVGARYYDPSSGRFLQRDPIGIEGDLNVYTYASGGPTNSIDPDGLTTDNPGGAAGRHPRGVREVAESVSMKNARQLAAKAAREAAKNARKAKEIMRNNRNFKDWFHKTGEKKYRIHRTKNERNPDALWEDIWDAYEDWLAAGCPTPK